MPQKVRTSTDSIGEKRGHKSSKGVYHWATAETKHGKKTYLFDFLGGKCLLNKYQEGKTRGASKEKFGGLNA